MSFDIEDPDHANITGKPAECEKGCDFEHAKHPHRAVWLCPHCKRDFSIEYIFWAKAVHPEWFESTEI